MLLGARLRHSRKASGIRAVDIAAHLGVTTRALRHWETGRRNPSGQRVAQWAELTGFPIAWYYQPDGFGPDEEAA